MPIGRDDLLAPAARRCFYAQVRMDLLSSLFELGFDQR
jgi:hypothetical protein